MKKYRFFYHYNKPLSQQRGKTMWSVHFRGECHFTEHIRCYAMGESKARNTQPYAVIEGFSVGILKNKNLITIL